MPAWPAPVSNVSRAENGSIFSVGAAMGAVLRVRGKRAAARLGGPFYRRELSPVWSLRLALATRLVRSLDSTAVRALLVLSRSPSRRPPHVTARSLRARPRLVADPPTIVARHAARCSGPGFVLTASIVGSGELIATTHARRRGRIRRPVGDSAELPGEGRAAAASSAGTRSTPARRR